MYLCTYMYVCMTTQSYHSCKQTHMPIFCFVFVNKNKAGSQGHVWWINSWNLKAIIVSSLIVNVLVLCLCHIRLKVQQLICYVFLRHWLIYFISSCTWIASLYYLYYELNAFINRCIYYSYSSKQVNRLQIWPTLSMYSSFSVTPPEPTLQVSSWIYFW